MARQLDFESHTKTLAQSKGARLSVKRLGSGALLVALGSFPFLLRWAPVWLPAMLVAQITFFGLLPVLAEQGRLDRVEFELSQREDALHAAEMNTEKHRHMLADDIYRERVRKSISRSLDPPLFRESLVGPAGN